MSELFHASWHEQQLKNFVTHRSYEINGFPFVVK